MTHEFSAKRPPDLKSIWPGQYEVSSWIEYLVNIAYPLFLISTFKENGKPNANFCCWGFFAGESGDHLSIFSIGNASHTSANIDRDKEWCINIPMAKDLQKCMATISNNEIEDDEITQAGFTIEPAKVVKAPRIQECPVRLECRLEWSRPLFPDSRQTVFAGRVLHIAVEDVVLELDMPTRIKRLGTMYNFRSQIDPLKNELSGSGYAVLDGESFCHY